MHRTLTHTVAHVTGVSGGLGPCAPPRAALARPPGGGALDLQGPHLLDDPLPILVDGGGGARPVQRPWGEPPHYFQGGPELQVRA